MISIVEDLSNISNMESNNESIKLERFILFLLFKCHGIFRKEGDKNNITLNFTRLYHHLLLVMKQNFSSTNELDSQFYYLWKRGRRN